MMRLWSCGVVIAASVLPGWGSQAQDHAGHVHEASAPLQTAPIVVTINPEARVSARWFGPGPAPPRCGSPVEIAVAVENQGFVTGALQAHIVGLVPAGVALRLSPQPLNGRPSERRTIGLTLADPGPVDLTLEFSIPHEHPDLGGRARVHILVACRA